MAIASGAVGDYIRATILGGSNAVTISAYKNIAGNHGFTSIYVKKGMKAYVQSAIGTTTALKFIPFA